MFKYLYSSIYICNSNSNTSNNTTENSNIHNKHNKMKKFINCSIIFMFFFWILITFLFSSSLYSASKILQKEVHPFFDQNISSSFKCSPQIIDSYDGTLHSVQQLIDKNQYTFIYLYADWCARSKRFRELIADLSCLHSNEIRFIAINCFVADCQKTFNLAKYPQVLVQTRDAGLFFYRGPFELNHFSNYLKLIQMPLQRIDDLDQFIQFIIKNDGAVIGNFDFSNEFHSAAFKIYYQSAIKTLHYDIENPIRFAVILDQNLWQSVLGLQKNSKKLNLIDGDNNNKHGIIFFSQFGSIKYYKNLNSISIDGLTFWAQKNMMKRSLIWQYPDREDVYNHKMNNIHDRLLVFMPRNLSNSNINKNFAIVKYIVLEKLGLFTRENKFSNFVADTLNTKFESTQYCESYNYIESLLINTCLASLKSNKNLEIYLYDSTMYTNYANHLLNAQQISNSTYKQPIVILIDFRNESLYSFSNIKFNYDNLKKFIVNQTTGKNQRHIRSKTIHASQEPVSNNNIIEINSLELSSIMNGNSNLNQMDLLIFYFTNWCGFCKTLNFHLVQIMHKYFRNVTSFKLLKIDSGLNEFEWPFHAALVPTLLLVPASIQGNKSIDSYTFNYDQNYLFNKTNLLRFILFHSRHPLTLATFIQDNMWQDNERFNFTQILTSKLNKLQNKADLLNKKILFAFENINKTNNLQSVNRNNIELDYNSNYYFYFMLQKIDEKNQFDMNTYENIYLKNIRDSLIAQLNIYLHEIKLLKYLISKK